MINPTTHAIAEFPIPTANAGPFAITAGPDGNLWFTESLSDPTTRLFTRQIGMINPTTHAIAEFPVSTASGPLLDITSDPDGNLWFTDPSLNTIGQFPLSTATPAPPQVAGSAGVSQSKKGTSYNVAFDQPLSADSVSNAGLYRVFEGVTKVVKRHKETVYTKVLKIKSVAYNPASNRVTIMLSKRYKGTGEVTIAPGLVGADGTTSSTITLDVR
jgi:hypothetical protein